MALGPSCKKLGLTLETLKAGPVHILPKNITQSVIYEIAKYREESSCSIGELSGLVRNLYPNTDMKDVPISNSCTRLYTKAVKMRKNHQYKKLESFLHAVYKPPACQKPPVELLSDEMQSAVLNANLPPKEVMHLATAFGTAVGKYTSVLDANLQQRDHHIDNLQLNLQAAGHEITSLQSKSVNLENEKSTLQTAISQITKEKDSLVSRIVELKPKNVKRRIETKRKQMTTLRHKVNTLETDLDSKQGSIEKLNSEVEGLKSENLEIKKKKVTAQKKASKYKMRAAGVEIPTTDDEILFLQNELEVMKEKLEESTSQTNSIQTFKDGTFTDETRSVYMELLARGVSVQQVEPIVRTVTENLTHVQVERLPKKSTAANFMVEANQLSKMQVGDVLCKSPDSTMHINGTTKKFEEYAAIEISTPNESLTLGYTDMPSGTANSYLDATKGALKEVADLMVESGASALDKTKQTAKLLSNVRNTMSDRHVVNKVYNDELKKYRENLLPLNQNFQEMDSPKKTEYGNMNNLYCGAHVVINLGSVAKEAMKDFENVAAETVKNSGFLKNNARSYDLIWEMSKAFVRAHGYQKAGLVGSWLPYLKEKGHSCKLISFKGERINVLFKNGGAAYYHRLHIQDFLSKYPGTVTKLVSAISSDIDDPLFQAVFRGLGIADKLITGPIMRAVEDPNKHIFDHNKMWEEVLGACERLGEDASPLLLDHTVVVPGVPIIKDCVFHELFSEQDAKLNELTKDFLRLLCCSFTVLISRQVKDQLSGGIHHEPSKEVMSQTASSPATNIISERDFSHLDRKLLSKPNISTIAVSGLVMFAQNKTFKWLESLTDEERSSYCQRARKEAPVAVEKYRENKQKIHKDKVGRMIEKEKRKEDKTIALQLKKTKLTGEVMELGGMWQNELDVDNGLLGMSESQKINSLSIQLQYRSVVIGETIDRQLTALSARGKKKNSEELTANLKLIISSPQTTTPCQSSPSQSTLRSEPSRSSLLATAIDKRVQKRQKDELKGNSAKKMKTDIIGKSILHLWDIGQEGKKDERWYEGKILKELAGGDFEVSYKGEPDVYAVPIWEDIADRAVVFPD